MIGSFLSWFRSRTVREQVLLQAAAFLVIGIGGAFLAYQSANTYRAAAASDLAAAKALQLDVGQLSRLAEAGPPPPPLESDGSVRGIATAAAAQRALKPARIEPAGPSSWRMAFEAAPAAAFLDWLDLVERAGVVATRVVLVRAGEGDSVTSEVTVAGRQR